MYTLEKNNTSPLCILCMLMSQIIPLFTLTLVCTWHEESTPMGKIHVQASTIPQQKPVCINIVAGRESIIKKILYMDIKFAKSPDCHVKPNEMPHVYPCSNTPMYEPFHLSCIDGPWSISWWQVELQVWTIFHPMNHIYVIIGHA